MISSCSSSTSVLRVMSITLGPPVVYCGAHAHLFAQWEWLKTRHSRRASLIIGKRNPAAGEPDGGVPNQRLCRYIRGQSMPAFRSRLYGAQIVRRRLAGAAVCYDFERNLLPFVEGVHACTFDRADMDEDILAALVRLNEAEALLVVKPFHCSRSHGQIVL